MDIIWSVFKKKWVTFFGFPMLCYVILCTPLFETRQKNVWEKRWDDSCKPFFRSGAKILAPTVFKFFYFLRPENRRFT